MAVIPLDGATGRQIGTQRAGWRTLGLFWVIVLVILAAGGGVLQYLGPRQPQPQLAAQSQPPRQVAAAPKIAPPAAPAPEAKPVASIPQPGRDTPGPIVDPDPALLEPATGQTTAMLPRIASDGRMPMQIYAAGFDRSSRRPRVGLVIAGVGLNQKESEAAIRALPGGITLAVSPYAADPTKLLAAARLSEHEYLISIPMEPQGFPLNDPGNQALMTNLPPEQNAKRLDWVLSRISGYVGATGALGGLRGERLSAVADQMLPILSVLAARGLLYVDPRPGTGGLPVVWGRNVDVIIDEPPDAAHIDDRLTQLSKLARDRGNALGLVGTVRPVTTQRIVAWANGLASDGLALTPVSALVEPPKAGTSK